MEKETKEENKTLLKLSIQVSLNGLSFCLVNSQKHKLVWYKKITFNKELNPVKVLEEIETFYQNGKHLQQEINEVVLLFSNDLYCLVPEPLFIEKEASSYLKYNTKILKTDVVAHDTIPEIEVVNVYIPYINITNYFFDRYGEFEYKHCTSILIQEILKLSPPEGKQVYLHNYEGYFDLVVIRDGKLLLCNTFHYETKEDFIYYLLFTAEQLKLDPLELNLFLTGSITKSSPFYEIVFSYVKNVQFLEPTFNLTIEQEISGNFSAEAFLLLKSLKCE